MKSLQHGAAQQTGTEYAERLNKCGHYLLVDILRPDRECTQGESSRAYKGDTGCHYFVPCETGNFNEVDLERFPTDVVFHVIPPAFDGCPLRFRVRGEERQTMAGGNFAYTSDSRFAETYGAPISIHDRTEG